MDQYQKSAPARPAESSEKTSIDSGKKQLVSRIEDLERQLQNHEHLITRLRRDLERMREGINAVAYRGKNG